MNLADAHSSNMKSSDMRNRVKLINDTHPDIMISIHQNSFPDESVKGAQAFYQINSDEGKKLAELLQSSMVKKVDNTNKRKSKESSSYYIIKNTECPSVILECGFLSNKNECANLQNEQYQREIAIAIADAVDEYFN